MLGRGTHAGGKTVAIADIGSGSAAVAIITTGTAPHILAFAREHLPLEDRGKDALRAGVMQALATAGEKALTAFTTGGGKADKVSSCYCIVGAPWTRSFGGFGRTHLDHETIITDAMVSALAKQALVDQKDVDRANLLEANVSRVLLNGYATSEPAGKRAHAIDLFTLVSDCDADIKSGISEALAKLFPNVQPVWRSSARAALAVAKGTGPAETCLVVEMGMEATDLLSLRKGVLAERVLLGQGVRQILSTLAKGKPVEETLVLFDMIEKDQCETEACQQLQDAIAKAEPDLAHVFGEAIAKLTTLRKLPDELMLIAPPALIPWLSRFFTRIDFTQFTATTRPFSVAPFSAENLAGVPHNDPALFTDSGLSIACDLVNMELAS